MFYSVNLMFATLLMLSTIIAISSPSWFCMWISIEMNTMAFIPLMYQINNKLPTESALKYFLTQTFASMIMLLSIIMMMNKDFYLLHQSSNIMTMSMGIKIGAAPFHMWYPSVIEGLSWIQNMILMTWQKIAPMTILYLSSPSFLILVMIISSLTIGPIMAFNQTSLRKIMAYSSITHMSWMMTAIFNKTMTWIYYMLFYFMTTIIVILMLWEKKTFYISQITSMKTNQIFMMMTNLLSMGGFPPTLGFIPKWIILNELIYSEGIFIAMSLIMSSCMNLYIYMRIIHSPLHLSSPMLKTQTKSNTTIKVLTICTSISTFLLFTILLI